MEEVARLHEKLQIKGNSQGNDHRAPSTRSVLVRSRLVLQICAHSLKSRRHFLNGAPFWGLSTKREIEVTCRMQSERRVSLVVMVNISHVSLLILNPIHTFYIKHGLYWL